MLEKDLLTQRVREKKKGSKVLQNHVYDNAFHKFYFDLHMQLTLTFVAVHLEMIWLHT